MNLTDTYGNKWALDLIKIFLDDNILDIPAYNAIGPSVRPGSEGMDEFWLSSILSGSSSIKSSHLS